jgi:hypothetical protein
MTQVFGLRKSERIALTLVHNFGSNGGHPVKHFRRADIPKIRRMAFAGLSASAIMAELELDMSEPTFRNRCKELQIKLCAKSWSRR